MPRSFLPSSNRSEDNVKPKSASLLSPHIEHPPQSNIACKTGPFASQNGEVAMVEHTELKSIISLISLDWRFATFGMQCDAIGIGCTETCLRDERWVGMGGRDHEKRMGVGHRL